MSRGTRERYKRVTEPFAYRAFTFFGGSFQRPSARLVFCNSPIRLQSDPIAPHNTDKATLAGLTPFRFGLIRVRSPLLTESQLLSLPGGTEMVHFSPLASTELCVHSRMTGRDPCRVSPFGHPRIIACLRLPRLIAAYYVLHRLSAPRHPP